MKNTSASNYTGSSSELVYHINCALKSIRALNGVKNKDLDTLEKNLTEGLDIATKNKLVLLEKAKDEPVYP